MPRTVTLLNVAGLALIVLAVGLGAYLLGGLLVALAAAAGVAGVSCLLIAWAVERPDPR